MAAIAGQDCKPEYERAWNAAFEIVAATMLEGAEKTKVEALPRPRPGSQPGCHRPPSIPLTHEPEPAVNPPLRPYASSRDRTCPARWQ